MIARLRLFDAFEVRGEIVLVRPGGAVDALQHGVALVAAPVRAGDGGQLERAEAAGGRDVRPAAEIEPFALAIDRERLVAGDAFDDLDLVLLAELVEGLDRLVAAQLFAAHRQIAFDDLGHLLFDAAKIFVGERAVGAEVVEEAVLDDRSDGDLRAGEELLHRHGHEMSGRVADGVEAGLAFRRDDLDLRVVRNRGVDVDDLAVHLAGEGILRQAPCRSTATSATVAPS